MQRFRLFSGALAAAIVLLTGAALGQPLGRVVGSNDLGEGLMIWDLDCNMAVCSASGGSFPNTVGFNGTDVYHVTGDNGGNALDVFLVPQPGSLPPPIGCTQINPNCTHVPPAPFFTLDGSPGSQPTHIEDLAFSNACDLWGADLVNLRLVRWNTCAVGSLKPATLVLPITGQFADGQNVFFPTGIASTPSGMYASLGFGGHSPEIGVINLTTGVYTPKFAETLPPYAFFYIHSLAYDSTRGVLWENLSFAVSGAQVLRQRFLDGSSAGPDIVLSSAPVEGRFDGFEHLSTPVSVEGRMTGGGSVFTSAGVHITHGFELHCDATVGPNNLEVNWGKGNNFHLGNLTSAACSDDPSIAPNPPAADFDTYVGQGTGRCNGVSGATIRFTFTDAGEPGKGDTARIDITGCPGGGSLSVSGNLNSGNQQAHED